MEIELMMEKRENTTEKGEGQAHRTGDIIIIYTLSLKVVNPWCVDGSRIRYKRVR